MRDPFLVRIIFISGGVVVEVDAKELEGIGLRTGVFDTCGVVEVTVFLISDFPEAWKVTPSITTSCVGTR